jgi:hypothetical protein
MENGCRPPTRRRRWTRSKRPACADLPYKRLTEDFKLRRWDSNLQDNWVRAHSLVRHRPEATKEGVTSARWGEAALAHFSGDGITRSRAWSDCRAQEESEGRGKAECPPRRENFRSGEPNQRSDLKSPEKMPIAGAAILDRSRFAALATRTFCTRNSLSTIPTAGNRNQWSLGIAARIRRLRALGD